MKNIENDIKNNEYRKVYLLYGEETYLRKTYKDKLRKAIVGEEASMNYNYYEGKGLSVSEIIGVAETMPFFASKRLIIIENSGFFKSANDELADYIESIPDTTCFVFVEEEIDKRNKLYKRVKDCGYACELNYLTEASLSRWILTIISKENKKITNETMNLFLMYTGLDMINIQNELEKLLSYTMDREVITNADVETICTPQVSGKIFEMIDSIGAKNLSKSLALYNDLIVTKEPPMRILYMLSRQFNIILKVKELVKMGMSRDDIAKNVGIQSFLVTKASKQAESFKIKSVINAIEDCVNAEEDVKNGRLDEMMAVESVIIKYSRK